MNVCISVYVCLIVCICVWLLIPSPYTQRHGISFFSKFFQQTLPGTISFNSLCVCTDSILEIQAAWDIVTVSCNLNMNFFGVGMKIHINLPKHFAKVVFSSK